jgi:hypothetical protein
MKKFFLIIFILFDLALISASVMFLIAHIKAGQNSAMTRFTPTGFLNATGAAPALPAVSSSTVMASTAAATSFPTNPATSAAPPNAHKIGFAYRNAHAKKVMIRADFTGWRAEPMQKDAHNMWKYMAVLEPGEYAYCFSVDDKSIRDPANKRTKQVGKTRVSAIVVQAQAAPSH